MHIGPYEVLGELGRGGMGIVLRARSPEGEDVAVKLLLKPDPKRLARFERERRLIARFTVKEGFVPLIDAGVSPQGPYLVMPLVRGGTLRGRLERGPLDVDETLALGRTLSRALSRAHARGIVHRDLKPENVLLAAGGKPLIADLGLAKHFSVDPEGGSQSVSLSQSGAFRGSVGYVAPEQIDDAASVGPAADVFALGAILYECLAGHAAFEGDSAVNVLVKVAEGKVRPLRRVRPEVPAWLAGVVERALSVDPGDRPADGLALLDELEGPGRGRRPSPGLAGPVVGAVACVAAVAAFLAWPRSDGGTVVSTAAKPSAEPVTPPRKDPVAPPAGPAPVVEVGRKLPARLRPGEEVRLADGTLIRVHLWRLPAEAGEIELVAVPPGDFLMGADELRDSEKPRHVHPMPNGYWIGRTPVTWRQYLAFCGATGRRGPTRPGWAGDDHPVVNVAWTDARDFCDWAGLALPTEAEWEKAARGTDGRAYPWGDTWDPKRANFLDASCPADQIKMSGKSLSELMSHFGPWDRVNSDGFPYSSPVGSHPAGASPYGALDMAGNVFQWCEDWNDDRAYVRYARGDTAPPASGTYRIDRGGCWSGPPAFCRTSHRDYNAPSFRTGNVGFRAASRTAP